MIRDKIKIDGGRYDAFYYHSHSRSRLNRVVIVLVIVKIHFMQ